MERLHALTLTLLLAPILPTHAQPADTAAPAASPESHQFDFLIGRWNIEVHPKVSSLVAMIHGTPRLAGTWEGRRAADGSGVEDTLRIVDGSGNPISLSRCKRTWAAAQKRWTTQLTDVTRGRSNTGSGQWTAGEMHLTSQYTEEDGTVTATRTRYYDIHVDRFRMIQDRSTDGGRTWNEGVLSIDARRAVR